MIDIHILTHAGTRAEWLDECLASLACEPCEIHVVSGTDGHIGEGRARGFALGAQPYVGFVDSDDYVLPGVMRACVDALVEHAAVVTDERVVRPDGTEQVMRGHHLFAARRETVMPLLPYLARLRWRPESVLRGLHPARVPFLGYVWRADRGKSHLRYMDDITNEWAVLRDLRLEMAS